MDSKNKYNALKAVRDSDGRPLIVEQLHAEIEGIKDDFMGEITPEKYTNRWNDLHLMQAKANTLKQVMGMLDRMIDNIEPSFEVENVI